VPVALPYLLLGVALVAALARWAHHRRRSLPARFARGGSAPIRGGDALLVGRVRHDGGPGTPVVVGEACFACAHGRPAARLSVTPFSIELPSGTSVQVEPDAETDGVSLDQTWRHADRSRGGGAASGHGVIETRVQAGDDIWIEGHLAREVSIRSPGPGYRGAGHTWVLRARPGARLRILSERVVGLHAARALFHLRWALAHTLAAAAATLATAHGVAPLAALIAALLPLQYWIAARESSSWEERSIDWS
jgi:hypothetical protein